MESRPPLGVSQVTWGLKPPSFQTHEGPQYIGYRELGGWDMGVEAEGQAEWREKFLKPTSWTLNNGGHSLVHPDTFHRHRASVLISRLTGQLGYSDLTCLELLLLDEPDMGVPIFPGSSCRQCWSGLIVETWLVLMVPENEV